LNLESRPFSSTPVLDSLKEEKVGRETDSEERGGGEGGMRGWGKEKVLDSSYI